VERRVGDDRGATVEALELVVAHLPEPPHVVERNVTPAARAHDLQLGTRPARLLDQPAEILSVLVRPYFEHLVAGRRPPHTPESPERQRPHLDAQTVEQPSDVASCAGARLRERRDVHPDDHAAASDQAARKVSPTRRQVKPRACSSPFGTSSSRRAIACSTAAAIAVGRSGSARTAASPHASSIDPCADATTGTPLAIAATIGLPKPSHRDGSKNAAAARYSRAGSSSST